MIVTYSTGDAVYLFNVSDTVVGMQVDCDEDLFAEYYYSVKLPIYRVMQAVIVAVGRRQTVID